MSNIDTTNSQIISLSDLNDDGGIFKIGDPSQLKLYNQLLKYNKDAAKAYFGTLYNIDFRQKNNPDRFRQAAHSTRIMCGLITRTDEYKTGKGMIENYKGIIKGGDPGGGAPNLLLDNVLSKLAESHTWFNKMSKISDPEGECTEAEFRNKLGEIEEILLKVTGNYFDIRDEIDDILKNNPSDEAAYNLMHKIIFWRNFEYLFLNASVQWLPYLHKAGFFSAPDKDVYIWPPTKYLVRISTELPDEAVKIICGMSDGTSRTVMGDMVELALNIDPVKAVPIADICINQKWIANGYLGDHWFGHKAIELVDHLVCGGEVKLALRLFKRLLDFRIVDKEWGNSSAAPLIGEFNYQELLGKHSEKLFEAQPVEIINILARSLGDVYKKCFVDDVYDINQDHSYLDYRDIDDRMSHADDAREALLKALVYRLEYLGVNKPDILTGAIKVCDQPVQIFKMVKFRIINQYSASFEDEIKNILLDVNNYHNIEDLGHAFADLLRDHYASLSLTDKLTVNSFFETFPEYILNLEDETQDTKNKWQQSWKYKLVFLIKDHVEGELKEWFEEACKNQHAPIYGRGEMTSWSGPTSDLSVDYFNATDPALIVKELKEWVSPKGFGVHSHEGRGRNLSESIKLSPNKFCELSSELIISRVNFVYIFHLFWGLEQAFREKRELDWNLIVDAGEQMSNLSSEEISEFPNKTDDHDYEYDGAFKSLLSLIDQGLGQEKVLIPINRRASVWRIIERGLGSSHPDLEYEKKYGGTNSDPSSMSINTTRGEAMHALVRYASWVTSQSDKKRGLPDDAMDKLDFHVHYENDPTETIHSIYGRYLPFLHYHEKNWVQENLQNIFPDDPVRQPLWKAALGAYMDGSMYTDLFPLLSAQYSKGIKYIESSDEEKNERGHFVEKISTHVSLALAHGADGAIDVGRQMFGSSNDKLKRHAIFHIGANVLKPELKHVSDQALPNPDNLKWIWEEMLDGCAPESAKGFGYWFVNSPYERNFTINSLLRTLRVSGGMLDADHKINSELLKYVDEFPGEVIDCVELILKGDVQSWHLPFRKDEYIKILRQAKSCGVEVVVEKIQSLADFLGKKGFDDFDEFR